MGPGRDWPPGSCDPPVAYLLWSFRPLLWPHWVRAYYLQGHPSLVFGQPSAHTTPLVELPSLSGYPSHTGCWTLFPYTRPIFQAEHLQFPQFLQLLLWGHSLAAGTSLAVGVLSAGIWWVIEMMGSSSHLSLPW